MFLEGESPALKVLPCKLYENKWMIAKDFCFQKKKKEKSILRNKLIFLRVYNN